MPHKHNLHVQGFSLIELLITVAIASILLSLAAPSFSTLVKNSRISASASEFAGSLYLARSEAIKRSTTVTICKSSNGSSCAANGNWDQGWITFEDPNADGAVDAAEVDGLIRVHKALTNTLTLVGNARVNSHITYSPNGRLSTVVNGTIELCDNRSGEPVGKGIVVIPSGRFRISTGIIC